MAEITDQVRRFLQGLLERMGERGTVETLLQGERLYIDLRGAFRVLPDDPGFREALSHLLRLYLRRIRGNVPFVLDINGKLKAREEELVSRAKRLAERAMREGRRIELEPMPPAERRIIHLALADHPGVRTYSLGQGNRRHVVIEPKK